MLLNLTRIPSSWLANCLSIGALVLPIAGAVADERDAQNVVAAVDEAPSEPLPARRGGAAPALPEPQLIPPAQIGPAPPPRKPAAPAQPLAQAPRFLLRGIKIEGNTVLDQPAIDKITAPYIGKQVTIGDLEEIRRQLTLLYVSHGYINSGAIIPDQDASAGIVTIRMIEGTVTQVEVTGTKWFKPEYFQSRLSDALRRPFNVQDAETEQQILLQDPAVKRLNIDLLPGLAPGEARMNADVLEARPYFLTTQIANDQSPTVGEIRGQLQGGVRNLLGYDDILTAQYGRSDGLNDGFVSYSVPLRNDDTRLNLRYDRNGTLVVNPSLAPLNITSNYTSVSAGLSRPFYRTPEATLLLGVNLEKRDAQTFLLGQPFSFTAGSDNGKTNVTALRFYQDWLDHDADHAFAVRSTFSFGIDALDATVTNTPPTGKFFDWLGQAQYVHRIFKDWEAVVRSDLQISDRPLFPIEQFALGGIDTVRGYRQYLSVTDDAFFASGELRIPVTKLRLPHLADSDQAGTVQLVPFYDFGRGWNVDRPTPAPAEISSVGAGFRWLAGSGVTLEVYYGKALRHVPIGTSLQDRGIHFRLTAAFF